MLEEYSIPKNEFITWALSNKSWKLISVRKNMADRTGSYDHKTVYVWMTESGRIVTLETCYGSSFDNTYLSDGLVKQEINNKHIS